MLRRNSLSFRIITRVLGLTITLFLFIMAGYYFYAQSIIIKSTRENAIELAGNIAGKIEKVLQPMEKIPQVLTTAMSMGLLEPDSLLALLQTIVSSNPTIYGSAIAFEPDYFPEKGTYYMLYAFNEGNRVQTMMLGSDNYDYFHMDWYQIPAMLKTPYWSEPYFDEGGGNTLMATYSVPFYCHREGSDRFAGVATIDLQLEWLTDIVSNARIFESGYMFILSRNGVAVTHPDKTQIMNKSAFSNSEEWNAPILREVGRDLINGVSQFREYPIPGREKLWIYYRNLESNKWSLSVVYPDREMFASLRQMNTIVIILIIVGLILLTLSISGIVRRLSSPLALFANSAHEIAQGNFRTPLPEVKTNDEMKELHDAFLYMQKELDEYVINLKEATAAREKIESELRIAREIQLAMIPHSFPPFPDLPQIDLFAMLKSAKEVGGDLYDFFRMEDKRFCFAIGDVSGKGVPASLFMAMTRTLLRTIADRERSPAPIMASLNRSLAFNNEANMFVTFFLGILDLSSGILEYSNAGHNPPVLIRKEASISFFQHSGSIPLGLFTDHIYSQDSLKLLPGDKIFAFTDGVSEAENWQKELFGEEKIMDIIRKYSGSSPRQLIEQMGTAIETHVAGNPQSDDITTMTIVFNS